MIKEIQKYKVRTDLYYDPENQYWVDIDNGIARFGLSPLVQETSGSFVAIQFHQEKKIFKRGESIGSLEAEKHVSHFKSPLSGSISKVNTDVTENPRLINTDPYGRGWLVEIKLSNLDSELKYLIQSEEEIVFWFESEIKKQQEKGWIAQQ